MGYMHIPNLYRPEAQHILHFKTCIVMEKVHGTSAHIAWRDGQIHLHPGGERMSAFEALFDKEQLERGFREMGHSEITIYGEAYGGRCQGMSHTYGPKLAFIVFDVRVGTSWLAVPHMALVAEKMGLEVVPWKEVSTDIEILNQERDAFSEVAIRRGMGRRPREGIIIRPLFEVTLNNGERVIAKHKGEAFNERVSTPKVVDASALQVLQDAEAIAGEWVTPMRLEHVLDQVQQHINAAARPAGQEEPTLDLAHMSLVLLSMIADIEREAAGEVVMSKAARQAISKRTAAMFKDHLNSKIST